VLDEFAADQDPGFRRSFYDTILPLLTQRGLTIVAVTHDERYATAASVHRVMQDGRLINIEGGHG